MGTAERVTLLVQLQQIFDKFLFAVARWGQRNDAGGVTWLTTYQVSIRCREMGTAERPSSFLAAGFYSLSRDGDSGTGLATAPDVWLSGFYSLSRDGDSGTCRCWGW